MTHTGLLLRARAWSGLVCLANSCKPFLPWRPVFVAIWAQSSTQLCRDSHTCPQKHHGVGV